MTVSASSPFTKLALDDLLRLSSGGDLAAWGQVVAAHRSQIFDYQFALGRDRHDADDLTQRTFEIARRRLPETPAYTHSFAHWLKGIAYNVARQAHGRRRTWEELSPELLSEAVGPAERATVTDELTYIWAMAEEHLSPRDFEIYWLRFGEDLSEEETAEAARVTRHQVAVALHRARKILATFRHSHS